MRQKAILMNAQDDVATALLDLEQGERVTAALEAVTVEVVLLEAIPFGHKFALRDLAQGEDVLKYGMAIGKATQEIKQGAWVHVHNCLSEHLGFHRQKYGDQA